MCVNCQNCEAVGKLFADLWEKACPFPWAVNGFSIGKAAVFHISMTQKSHTTSLSIGAEMQRSRSCKSFT